MMIDLWLEYFGWHKSIGSFLLLTTLFVLYTAISYSVFLILAVFLSSRFASRTEARLGARAGGIGGLLAPVAAMIRATSKREVSKDFWIHVNFAFQFAAVAGIIFTLPLNPYFYPIQSAYGIMVPLFLAFVFFTTRIALMFSAVSVEVRLSAVRAVAMVTACLAPLTFLLFFLGQEMGGYSFQEIMYAKDGTPHWTVLRSPLIMVAAVGFLFCSAPLIEGLRNETLRLDPLFSKIDIKFYNDVIVETFEFTWWIYVSVLFFGGWSVPFLGLDGSLDTDYPLGFGLIVGTVTMMLKGLSFFLLLGWIRRWLPVSRIDQLTDRIWKIGFPLSLILMIGGLVWKQIVSTD